MALALKQQSRVGEFKAASLGKDELVLTRFDGTEGLGELFTYNIEVLSEKQDFNFDKILGSKCTASIRSYEGTRHFNGMLVEAQWTGELKPYFSYRLVLRPWFWLLSRTTDCRIFTKKTPPQIIEDIFAKHGFAKFKNKLGSYEQIEYLVQYRETDLSFVTRVMEEFGIYYFFEHEENEHTLVLSDGKSSHASLPGGGSIPYYPLVAKDSRKVEHLVHWVPGRRFNTGKVELNDYDYFKPSADMFSRSESASGYQNSKLEFYDYPGRYTETSEGDKLARIRLEAEQATDQRCQATGLAVSLFPGALVSLSGHPTQSREYLIVRAMHAFSEDSYRSGSSADRDRTYSGRYEFLPSDKPFRSPVVTPKPVIRGPQTAKVVGEGEIDVDEHGRIYVQFHWDRKKDSTKIRRVRIGQVWSGSNWGGIFIPRVGMEVIVEFLEGDPDQPLVVGTVYNKDNKVPYDLPGDKTVAGWKSRSTTGGGTEDYNELVFDDKKGSELIRVHAQKDMETTIENNDDQTVQNNRTIQVTGSHTELVNGIITIESRTMIVLKVGLSTITMDPGSININAIAINVTGSGTITETSPLTTITGTTSLNLATNVFIARLNGGTPVITF